MHLKRIGKRGDTNWNMVFVIIQLILVVSIFISLFIKFNSVINGDDFEQNYIARDTALLIDTLYAAPGNVVFDYPVDLSHYDFELEIDDEKVKVINQLGKVGK